MTNVIPIGSQHICHRCDKHLPAEQAGCLVLNIDGGYGMFSDDLENSCRTTAYLCHDCSAELFRFMGYDPRSDTHMRGLHPYMNERGKTVSEPCCEYGWTPVRAEDGITWLGDIRYGYEEMA